MNEYQLNTTTDFAQTCTTATCYLIDDGETHELEKISLCKNSEKEQLPDRILELVNENALSDTPEILDCTISDGLRVSFLDTAQSEVSAILLVPT